MEAEYLHLAQGAQSESVQLRAWRGVLADLMSVSKFSVLEYRMAEIEEELDRRNRVAGCPARRQPSDKVNRMAEIEEQFGERTRHTHPAR